MTPQPYIRKRSALWWLSSWRYTKYMLRELSSIFVAIYAVILLVGVIRLSQGETAYLAYLDALQQPWAIVFHGVILAAVLFHAITWFNVTPKAMPLQIGRLTVPDFLIIAGHYAACLGISLAILWWVAGG